MRGFFSSGARGMEGQVGAMPFSSILARPAVNREVSL